MSDKIFIGPKPDALNSQGKNSVILRGTSVDNNNVQQVNIENLILNITINNVETPTFFGRFFGKKNNETKLISETVKQTVEQITHNIKTMQEGIDK